MPLSLKPGHLKRYTDIARLLIKYGRSDLLPPGALDEIVPANERARTQPSDVKAEALAADLEEMGPIFIKLGQLLSSRPDLLPNSYITALSRLQDKIAPFSFAEVELTIQQELGVRLSKAFSEFEASPIAVASLGQVHRAVMRDGRPVVVKVQRPGIREQITEDFEALEEIADFIDHHTEVGRRHRFLEVLAEFRTNLGRELDYQREARNLVQLAQNLEEFDQIVIPYPVEDFTTSRVLTMDYIRGKKITSLGPLARMELDGVALAEELHRAYLKQILVDGFFHADPHPGNVFLTDDKRIALLDLGMVGHLSSRMQEKLVKLLMAISEGRSDETVDLAITIGDIAGPFDERAFRNRVTSLVAQQQDSTLADIQVGKVMLEFSRTAGESGLRMPAELTMLSKTLLNLDEITRTLDPDFHPNDSIRRNVAEILRARMLKSLSPGHMFAAVMEAREFAQEFPSRVNHILDMLSKNQIKVQVEAIDEATLIEGFQKVANRITMGLILAALIIGAAMLMRVETSFRLFGYPGLAMLCFLGAAGGGGWLMLSILLQDRAAKPKE
jgi:ubiquinone biosynthesis protein